MTDFYPELTKTDKYRATKDTPAKEKKEHQKQTLIKLLFHDFNSMTDACRKLGITRETGYVWYREWKTEQEPEKIDKTFWRLMQTVEQDNPEKALDSITKLKIKLTDTNVNVKAEVTETIEANVTVNTEQLLKEYDQIIKTATETPNIPKNNTTKPLHQTETPP